MRRPPPTAILPDGFVELWEAINIAGRIEYPEDWTGEEFDAEWDWWYRDDLEKHARQRLETLCLLPAVRQEMDAGFDEAATVEGLMAKLYQEDKERNRPRQRWEDVTTRLREVLYGGLIAAKALLPSGRITEIQDFVWAGENAPEIFKTGSVCVENDEVEAPRTKTPLSQTAYVLLHRQETETTMKGDVPNGGSQSRADIEAKCKRWLKQLIEKSPAQRVDTKDNLYAQAKEDFSQLGHLARNAFDRAWDWAIEETNARAWKGPGRPKGK